VSAPFRQSVRQALSNPVLQEALDNNAARRKAGAQQANASLNDPAAVRQHARAIRSAILDNWDPMLAGFVEACQANGIVVLRAASAQQACAQVLEIARRHGVHRVAKAKSMVSEEIHLNAHLEAAGLEVVETDLGEFIVQLRGEPPAHIITPALHLRRQEVGRTFADHLGMPYTDDISAMTDVARRTLRQVFLTADMGISGVNLAAADTGTLCLVTNEGNGRMVTTLPPVHVALMGIERLVPTIEDLAVILQLLPRNATGQILTSYVTLIQGPGKSSIADGAQHRYLILIDNGRRAMHGTPLAEALMCIRCGACLNDCPVFQELGGHAYGSAYPGPIGSVVSPGLFGVSAFGHLAKASSLCGACKEACPIGIDIPRMLLQLRHEYVSSGGGRRDLRWGLRLFAWGAIRPSLFAFAQRLAALATSLLARGQNWLHWLPPPGNAWTGSRHFPPIAARTLHQRWRQTDGLTAVTTPGHPVAPAVAAPLRPEPARTPALALVDQFTQALTAVSGEVVAVEPAQIPAALRRLLPPGHGPGLVPGPAHTEPALLSELRRAGFELLDGRWPAPSPRASLEQAKWGIVWARAGLADSGTVVLPSNPAGTLTASLLPPLLVVILSQRDLQASLAAWLAAGGKALVESSPMVVLVTGPSRTSDIEMTMTLGVHGPGRLIVLLTP
jgi:L-lactate dehydrogenase complex protein LldF